MLNLVFPDLGAHKADHLTVCGNITSQNDKLKELADKYPRWMYFHKDSAKGTVYVRLGVNWFKGKVRIHIELATRELFGDDDPPNPTKGVPGYGEILEGFIGQTIDALVTGQFICQLDELPEIINITRKLNVNQSGIKLKMTAGTLSVEGLPVTKIRWDLREKTNRAVIGVTGVKEFVFSDTYLQENMAFISGCYSGFLSRGIPNG
jgi:hypothetical protein